MKPEDIDSMMKEYINHLNSPPPQVSWNKEKSWHAIEEQLKPAKKTKVTWPYYAVAASFALLLGLTWYLLSFIHKQETQISSLAKELQQVQSDNLGKHTILKNEPVNPVVKEENIKTKNAPPGNGTKQVSSYPDKKFNKEQSPLYHKQNDLKNASQQTTFTGDTTLIQKETGVLAFINTDSISTETQIVKGGNIPSVQETILKVVNNPTVKNTPKQVTVVFPADTNASFLVMENKPKEEQNKRFNNIIINGKSRNILSEEVNNQSTTSFIFTSINK